MGREIILKADDRGNEQGVLKGIDELVTMGVLTDVALIIQFTQEEQRDLLQAAISQSPLKETPGVGILLHVNTTTGKPISNPEKVCSLVDENGIFKKPKTTRSAWEEYTKTISMDDFQRELEAQIERFYKLFGHYPHALDAHNMSLWFPKKAAQITLGIASELKVAVTNPKIYTDQIGKGPFNDIFMLEWRIRNEARSRGIPIADHASVTYWNSSDTLDQSVRRFLAALDNLEGGITEFFFHPGHPDYVSVDPRYQSGRVRDFQLLTDPKVVHKISTLSLTSYKQLSNSMPPFNSQLG